MDKSGKIDGSDNKDCQPAKASTPTVKASLPLSQGNPRWSGGFSRLAVGTLQILRIANAYCQPAKASHANHLLAFLLALQSPQVGTLAKDSATNLGTKLATEPDDWEDIEDRLETLSKDNPALKTAYQDFQARLQDANLTPEILLGLLPTEEEIRAFSPSQKPVTFSPPPSKPHHPLEGPIINVALPILKDNMPAQASKTLLQRVSEWLKNR